MAAPPSVAGVPLPSARVDPEVALPWVINLRWVAVTGQALTIFISSRLLELRLPVLALGGVIALTFATNVALKVWLSRVGSAHPRVLGAVLSLDTLLLTALLGLSGGPSNPFAILYVIHVALAAVALPMAWAWWMVGLSALCYALLHPLHVPLHFAGHVTPNLEGAGRGVALVLVAANVAYFTAGVVAALRRREEDLREAEAQLKRNEFLASLAALAAGTAHELGTPLGTIAVVSKELERTAGRQHCGQTCGHDIREDAQLIREQVERCRRILDRLGTLDHEGLGNAPEPLGLDALLANLREDLQGAGRFEVEVDPGVDRGATVHPDAAHALLPLLENALDATEGQGRVLLSVGHSEGGWSFTVEDEGPGMPSDVLERARQPFFTTKEHGRGMGLGLYLVGLTAERHGGRFELSSQPGSGVRAALTFPDSPSRTEVNA